MNVRPHRRFSPDLAVGDAGALRVADRRRRAGLRYRDDQVGLGGTPRPAGGRWPPGGVTERPAMVVSGRPVDVLEHAALRLGAANRLLRRPFSSMASSSPGSTSRTKLAPTMSSRPSRWPHPAALSRPSTSGARRRVAAAYRSARRRTPARTHPGCGAAAGSRLPRARCRRRGREQLVIRSESCGASPLPLPVLRPGHSPRRAAQRCHQVAVVAHTSRCRWRGAERGWAFSQVVEPVVSSECGRPRGGRAARQSLLVEDLADQPEILEHHDLATVADAIPAASWPRCCSAKSPK